MYCQVCNIYRCSRYKSYSTRGKKGTLQNYKGVTFLYLTGIQYISEIDSDELRCILKKLVMQEPQPLLPHKDQQSDIYPQTKTALGELWSPLKKLQQHSGTKIPENNCRREGRQLHFACSIPSPSWHCSAPGGNFPARKSSPCQEGRVE